MPRWLQWARSALRPGNVFLWSAALLWLVVSWIGVVGLWSDWSALSCGRDDRLRHRFEDLLFYHPTQPVGMVGPDGHAVPNYPGPELIAGEIAACFPKQIVEGKLRLPPGEMPAVFKAAVHAAFEISQGERRDDYDWFARFYPMNSPAAPCVLAATKRVYEIAEATVPPPHPRCKSLAVSYVKKWLLIGWLPVLLALLTIRAVRARMASTPRRELSGWRRLRAIGLALVSACSLAYGLAVVLLLDPYGWHHVPGAFVPILVYGVVAYLVIPLVVEFIRSLPP
jgi:hypothetical protein